MCAITLGVFRNMWIVTIENTDDTILFTIIFVIHYRECVRYWSALRPTPPRYFTLDGLLKYFYRSISIDTIKYFYRYYKARSSRRASLGSTKSSSLSPTPARLTTLNNNNPSKSAEISSSNALSASSSIPATSTSNQSSIPSAQPTHTIVADGTTLNKNPTISTSDSQVINICIPVRGLLAHFIEEVSFPRDLNDHGLLHALGPYKRMRKINNPAPPKFAITSITLWSHTIDIPQNIRSVRIWGHWCLYIAKKIRRWCLFTSARFARWCILTIKRVEIHEV